MKPECRALIVRDARRAATEHPLEHRVPMRARRDLPDGRSL